MPSAVAVTDPVRDGKPAAPTFWIDPQDRLTSLIAADKNKGPEVFAPQGHRLQALEGGGTDAVSLAYDIARSTDLLLATDLSAKALHLYRVSDGQLQSAAELPLAQAPVCVATHHDAATDRWYAFVVNLDNQVTQYRLFEQESTWQLKAIRSFAVGGKVKACAVDDRNGQLFIVEDQTAIWRYDTSPEAGGDRVQIDAQAPLGHLQDLKGLAIVQQQDGNGVLLGIDEEAALVRAWSLTAPYRYLGQTALTSADGKALRKPDSIAASAQADALAIGPIKTPEGARFGLFRLHEVLAAMGIAASGPPASVRSLPTISVPVVTPTAETTPVSVGGDAADDPAIWVNPQDPKASLIIGTNKKDGVQVYDLRGHLKQTLSIGRINNVDLREQVDVNGHARTIVAGSNRSDDTLALLQLDPATGLLSDIADGAQDSGLGDPYGLCMYQSRKTHLSYVFVNDTDGNFRQFELVPGANGRLSAREVRRFKAGSQTEGCVADDETATLYFGEEDVALWMMSAEPDSGTAMSAIDRTGDAGHLVADIEGMSLWLGPGGSGYLVVSSQGENAYAVYDRQAPHRYRGKFHVVANDALGIDGSSETDGLDVSSANLGGAYAEGLLVVQDGHNVAPPENQNFKLIPWTAVKRALQLN